MFQWLLVAVLVYVIYYLVNKYEKRLNNLTEIIEINKSKIDTHHEKITKNRERIDINQEILAKLKD